MNEPTRTEPRARTSLSIKKKQMLRPRHRIADATTKDQGPHPHHQKPAAQGANSSPVQKTRRDYEDVHPRTYSFPGRQAGRLAKVLHLLVRAALRATPYTCSRHATWMVNTWARSGSVQCAGLHTVFLRSRDWGARTEPPSGRGFPPQNRHRSPVQGVQHMSIISARPR
jgi:hypothetical protein